ncbi:MAG: hypothetical protein AAF928_16640 [Myxococcota bacterium]
MTTTAHTRALLGVLPLTAWVLGAAGQYHEALSGPQAFVGAGATVSGALAVLVVVALAVHEAMGIVRRRAARDNDEVTPTVVEDDPETVTGHPLYRTFRRSVAVVIAYAAAEVALFHLPRWRGQVRPEDASEHLVALLSGTTGGGIPFVAMGLAVGWATTGFHAGFAWFAATERWRPRVLPGPRRLVAIGCGSVALVVYGVGLHGLVHLANGTRVGGPPPAPAARGLCTNLAGENQSSAASPARSSSGLPPASSSTPFGSP